MFMIILDLIVRSLGGSLASVLRYIELYFSCANEDI